MKKLLSLLLFLMLLCIPQDAGAWGDLYLLYNNHEDCTHLGGDNGWSNVSSTNALKLTNATESDVTAVTAWSGELTVSDDDWQEGSGVLNFRFAAQYCGWVSTAAAFPLATQQNVASRDDENNMTISQSLGYNKFKINVVNNGGANDWQVTIAPVAETATTYTFYFDNTSTSYTTPKVYAYNAEAFGAWSGAELTNPTENLYTKTVTYNVGDEIKLIPNQTQLIFNDNGNGETQFNAGVFVNNKVYGGAAKTVYFLTPFNDKDVKIWAWKDGETIDGFSDVEWGNRPSMTANGSMTYNGATHYIYSYTFTGAEPAYLNIDEGGLEVIKDAAYESGKYYVYEKTIKTIKLVNDHPWDDIYVYAWGGGGERLGGWPGQDLNGYDPENPIDETVITKEQVDGKDTYTIAVKLYEREFPTNLIFHNNKGQDSPDEIRKAVAFADGAEIHTQSDQTYTIYFKNTVGWDDIHAYTYDPETGGDWPGVALKLIKGSETPEDKTDDVYRWTYTGFMPKALIFNGKNGETPEQAKELLVWGKDVNGKTYQAGEVDTDDHNYRYLIEVSSGNEDTSELTPKAEVDGHEVDGHDVIYQLNFGSFTEAGTIAAATEQLDYLKGKGVDVIWVMPIHPRGGAEYKVGDKGSPYAATDYSAVNTEFGTIDDFKTFVTTAHEKGMKVWLDWAANHTAVDHVWVNSHPDYYVRLDNSLVPNLHPMGGNITYNDVWQLDLRDQNATAQDAMIAEMKKWVDGTNAAVDGFRCDMANGFTVTIDGEEVNYMPTSFWTKAISELKAVVVNGKPRSDLKFLAESDLTHHNVDLTNSGWDLDYAWNFHNQLKGVANINTNPDATAVKKVADEGAFDNSHHMFYVTNHDVADGNSLKTLFGQNAYPLTVMEFTLPGTPLLYNGQENGYLLNNTVKFSDDQKVVLTTHDYKMENTIKQLINLKHSNPALADGDAKGVYVDLKTFSDIDNKVESTQMMAYARRFGAEWVLVVLNLSSQPANATIDGLLPGTWKKVLDSENIAFGIGESANQTIEQATSLYLENVEPHGYRIYTLTADTDYKAGYYMLYDGNWTIASSTAQAAAPQLTKKAAGSAVQDGVYTFVIDDTDFNTYADGTEPNRIYFKIKEFYEYYGTVIPNVADIVRPFKENKETEKWDIPDPEFTIAGEEKSPLWNLPTSDNKEAFYFDKKDGVLRYIVTLKRIREPHYDGQGNWTEDTFNTTVQVQFVTSLENTFYLHHYNNDGTAMVNTQMNTYSEDSDENDAFLDLLGTDEDYQYAIGITPAEFDNYTLADKYGRLFFAFQEGDGNGLKGYVAPDGTTQGRPLTETSNVDNETKYLEWEQVPTDIPNFWKGAYYIKKQAGVKQYIIKLRKNNDDTYAVKVEFRKTEPFKGNDVAETLGEKVYLYNVGAKKFVIATGAWGTEAGLLFNDLGMQYKLSKTAGSDKYYTVANTVKTSWGTQLGIDDGNGQIRFYVDRGNGNLWSFNEVPGKPNTYEMVLFDGAKGGNVFAYAGNTVIGGNDDGVRQAVPINERNDEVCFTQNKKNVTGGDNSLEKYFQWKIVRYSELLDLYRGKADATDNYGKANEIDGTFLLNDFAFARGNTEVWTQETLAGAATTNIFNKNRMGDYNLTGKFYHALIQNSGKMYQTVRCYQGGIYRFRCNGFSKGQKVKMFVTYPTANGTETREQQLLAADRDWQKDGYQDKNGNLPSPTNIGDDGVNYGAINNSRDDILAGQAFMNNEYVNDMFFYIPQSAINGSTETDETYKYVTVTIGFEVPDGFNKNSDYTAIDNARIHYIGRSPFVLDETKTAASEYAYNSSDEATWNNGNGTDTQVPIYLKREFWENQWNPIILPFDVEEDDILAAFGPNTQLADPYGLDDNDPYLIKFTSIPTAEGIVAGHFYLIKPSKLNYQKDVQMVYDSGENVGKPYTIEGNSLSLGIHPLFGQIKKNLEAEKETKLQSQVFAPSDLWSKHNSIKLIGSYFKQQSLENTYPFVFAKHNATGRVDLLHMVNDQKVTLGAFRFYITDVDKDGKNPLDPDASGSSAGAKNITFDDLFDGIDIRDYEQQEATGILEVGDNGNNSQAHKNANGIYDLSGRKVAGIDSKSDLKTQLPSGIYIVNGKKMIVR